VDQDTAAFRCPDPVVLGGRDEAIKCCRIELDARGALSEATVRNDADAC
jgi:hypothetical protein